MSISPITSHTVIERVRRGRKVSKKRKKSKKSRKKCRSSSENHTALNYRNKRDYEWKR